MVGRGAGEEDVYEQYLGALGGLNRPYDEVSKEKKHLKINFINNSSAAVLLAFNSADGEILITLCGLISVVTKYLILMPLC